MSSSGVTTISLNRFHRLSLWCRDCDSYWQLPNYLVYLHGSYNSERMKKLININLYLYNRLFDLDVEKYFGENYVFKDELHSVFDEIKTHLSMRTKKIQILDMDILAILQDNMSSLIEFVLEMKASFDETAETIIRNSPKNFRLKLDTLKRHIIKSLETDNIKIAIDNLMDLNIAGLDPLVQCVGIIFNCFYILSIDIQAPLTRTEGAIYCDNPDVIIERLSNISAQNFLYKYKRRWLVYYRKLLTECKSIFGTNIKQFDELSSSGNFETIEAVLYDILISKNNDLLKTLTILKHSDRYPKGVKDIYQWWSGRSNEQLQKIYNLLDNCISIENKTTLLPFILTHKMSAKDRMYYEIYRMLKQCEHVNVGLSQALSFIVRIYPEVFEQVYFPDRERYMSINTDTRGNRDSTKNPSCNSDTLKLDEAEEKIDVLDNIRNKNVLRKCENSKCYAVNKGRNVIWNLNSFEIGKQSMNSVFKELVKNPSIFEEIFAFANKKRDVLNNTLSVKRKIIYK